MEYLIWAGIWLLIGVLLVGGTILFEILFQDCDHLTLEDILLAGAFSLLGLLLIPVGIFGIYMWIKDNKGKIVIWKSKSYKTKEVLAIQQKSFRQK